MTMRARPIPHEVVRDQRIGRRLAFTGGARILSEGAHPIDNRERMARWRSIFHRLPIEARTRRLP